MSTENLVLLPAHDNMSIEDVLSLAGRKDYKNVIVISLVKDEDGNAEDVEVLSSREVTSQDASWALQRANAFFLGLFNDG